MCFSYFYCIYLCNVFKNIIKKVGSSNTNFINSNKLLIINFRKEMKSFFNFKIILVKLCVGVAILFAGGVFMGCEKSHELVVDENLSEVITTADIEIKIGKQLNDPYRLENMQKAYNKLKGNSKDELQATHKYVKFLPTNLDELNILNKDTSLVLFDYPLDYEIINEGGSFYHDSSLPDSVITWQYAVVEKGKKLPNIYYEHIYDVYIPSFKSEKSEITQQLEHESYNLVGIETGKSS